VFGFHHKTRSPFSEHTLHQSVKFQHNGAMLGWVVDDLTIFPCPLSGGICGPYSSELTRNLIGGQSSTLRRNFLDFRYAASFLNQSALKATGVVNRDQISGVFTNWFITFLLPIRYVTLWPWPLTFWPWTSVMYRLLRGQTPCQISAKLNNLRSCYSDSMIENFGAVRRLKFDRK